MRVTAQRSRRAVFALLSLAVLAGASRFAVLAHAEGLPNKASEPTQSALAVELRRSLTELKLPEQSPPYFGAYWLVDFRERDVRASLGQIVDESEDSGRRLSVELRVGDPNLDNSNFAGNGATSFDSSDGLTLAPDGNDPLALRRAFWLASDSAYRQAVELLEQKRTSRSSQVELESRPPDFSSEQLASVVVDRNLVLPELVNLRTLARAASRVFLDFPQIEDSSVSVVAWWIQRTLVAGDSKEIVFSREPTLLVQFQLQCAAQAVDGSLINHAVSVFGVPSVEALEKEARALARGFEETLKAELAGDSFGPVLFAGTAAAQIAHEMLAMNLSGTPPGEDQEPPLARRLGKRVLPAGFVAFDDPSLEHYAGMPLVGGYQMDDEGVRPRRVDLVEDGRLTELLMSRTPNREIALSNGHGRSGLGNWAKGMVGNLVLENKKGMSRAELERRLLAAAKDQRAEFGVVIERLAERAFATGGMAPPVPERAYKLYPDGRRVPIRGAELSEINVRELRTLLAAGKQPNAYHYVVQWPSGLPSGSSVIAPDLLFEEVELTKPKRSYRRPKVLSRPR